MGQSICANTIVNSNSVLKNISRFLYVPPPYRQLMIVSVCAKLNCANNLDNKLNSSRRQEHISIHYQDRRNIMKQMSPKVLKCNGTGTVKEWKCQCMPLRTTTYKIMGTKSNVTMHVPLNVFNGWLIDSAQFK